MGTFNRDLFAVIAFAASTYACGEDASTPGRGSSDGGRATDKADAGHTTEGAKVPTSKVVCCPPSPQPNCCMDYGGAQTNGGCTRVCDGMPVPSDPAWRLIKDEYGCPRWSSEGTTATCCGGKPLPGGARAFSCYGDHGEPPQALDGRLSAATISQSVRDCETDADCCVVYDACRAQALVVGTAGQETVRQLLDDAPNDKCHACIAPRVQVACVAGVCVGADVSLDAGIVAGLEQDHCGTIGKPSTQAWQQTPLGCGMSQP